MNKDIMQNIIFKTHNTKMFSCDSFAKFMSRGVNL